MSWGGEHSPAGVEVDRLFFVALDGGDVDGAGHPTGGVEAEVAFVDGLAREIVVLGHSGGTTCFNGGVDPGFEAAWFLHHANGLSQFGGDLVLGHALMQAVGRRGTGG